MGHCVAFDVGNSTTSVGVHDGRTWLVQWRLRTDPHRTADELRVLLRSLYRSDGLDPLDCRRAVVASVVPDAVAAVSHAAARLFGLEPLLVAPGIRTGINIRYRPPDALGADRLADVVAGRAQFGSPVVVVDFGTATTFNVVDNRGEFVGGAIAPGVGTAASALAAAGAKLSPVDLDGGRPVPTVGRNTEQAMRGGILHGYAGLVAGLLERFDRELAGEPPVVATGGHAAAIAPLVKRIGHVDPLLTLEGLRLLGLENPQ